MKKLVPSLIILSISFLAFAPFLHAGLGERPADGAKGEVNPVINLSQSDAATPTAGQSGTPDTTLKAIRAAKGPAIDGNLSDPVWQEAIPFSAFTQVFPVTGAAPTEKTELRILYDDDNLYLGIYCYDSQPGKISANTMAHDADNQTIR